MKSQRVLRNGGVLCVFGSAVCGYLSLPGPREGFAAVPRTVDFGQVEQRQVLHAKFELVNHYRQALAITHIVQGCSCSAVQLGAKDLGPGQRTTLTASWDTGTSRGARTVHVVVRYTLADGRTGELPLTMQGDVLPDIACQPQEAIFKAGVAAEQTFRLTPGRLRHFLVTGAFCAHRAFKATVNEKEKSVTVAFDPSRWTDGDDYVPTLTVVTSSSREPRLMLPLKVESSAGKERSGP